MTRRNWALYTAVLLAAAGLEMGAAPAPAARPAPVQHKWVQPPLAVQESPGKDKGPLKYWSNAKGDRVPDYSYAGYAAAVETIPNVPIRAAVAPAKGDQTAQLQAAIDYVSTLPLDNNGFRGAVLLERGRFEIAGWLTIHASGVILRGCGTGPDGTQLVATGLDRRTVITLAGSGDREAGSEMPLATAYVPVNALQVRLATPGGVKVGDRILLRRPSTYEWIKAMGMEDMGGDRHGGNWKEGTRDLAWDRAVTAVSGDLVTFDAPITCALDPQFGGGTLAVYTWPGRIRQVGVENLLIDSDYNRAKPKDEDHAWLGITMDKLEDAWIRQVAFRHFVGGAVALYDDTRRVTVEDCRSTEPISENAGYRRHTFFTSGQQTLFQRCYSDEGRHDFSVGFCAAGPNAFVQCWADRPLDDSGPIDSLAAGVLYDNVRIEGNALSLYDRSYRGHSAGFSAVNSFIWQVEASVIRCYAPPAAAGGQNWAYGAWGTFEGNGDWANSNDFVNPISLYYGQLADRIGPKAKDRALILRDDLGDTPTRGISDQLKTRLVAEAYKPAPQMQDWSDELAKRFPIPTNAGGAKRFDAAVSAAPAAEKPRQVLAVKNGWLVVGDRVLTGNRREMTYWDGGLRPHEVAMDAAKNPCPTRFMPGRFGPGLTEDLSQDVAEMVRRGDGAFEHHYALWYDVRDADHERVRRMDGEVFPPFYELPFQRSGEGLAWDGLSKYDLTKYNPWYWGRLAEFADLLQQNGKVLIDEHFFQHNILEAGAHFASSPWRTANNINNTGFPEPPRYAGDKRIFMAPQFYDVKQPVRRALFKAFIRKNLENFGRQANVLHFTSGEYQGPLEFTQFWIDTIAEWEKETGQHPIIGLSANKDVQDAILADPVRSRTVDVIDIQYWFYKPSGELFAPPGGANLAPRQTGLGEGNGTSFEQALRAVREYKQKFPDKAVTYRTNSGWAGLIAGGSLASGLQLDERLARSLVGMKPIDLPGAPRGQWALGDVAGNTLVYASTGSVTLQLPAGNYLVRQVEEDGSVKDPGRRIAGGSAQEVAGGAGVKRVWVSRE
jgi:hypothetical protein